MKKVWMFLFVASLTTQAQTPAAAWKEFTIGPPTANRTRFGPDGIRAEGIPLRRLLSRAYGIAEHRIIGPSWIDDERYAITALVAEPKDLQPLLQQELAARFHMLAHKELKDVPVFEIRAINGAASPVSTAPAASARGPAIKMNQITLKAFADVLADVARRPVFDESHIDGRFDVNLSWDGSTGSLPGAVRSQLGLDLVDARRTVELLIVDHMEKPQLPGQ